ncbi:hypothetical protein [Streptacidiphilus pinicola]|uniref:hypothetical protein n=1 Tax=Streptacidiphilus pinicola TaxID=2219663 RepID=UPI001A9F6EDD|nr:hypothetical protein [Streptacidiphilus pinicola]
MFRFSRAAVALSCLPVIALAAGCSGHSGPTPAEASASAASASAAAASKAAAAVHAAQLAAGAQRQAEYRRVGQQLDQALERAGITESGRKDAAYPASPTGCLVGYAFYLPEGVEPDLAQTLHKELLQDGWTQAPPVSDGYELTWHNWQAWINPTKLPNPAWVDVPFSGPGQVVEVRAQSGDADCQ